MDLGAVGLVLALVALLCAVTALAVALNAQRRLGRIEQPEPPEARTPEPAPQPVPVPVPPPPEPEPATMPEAGSEPEPMAAPEPAEPAQSTPAGLTMLLTTVPESQETMRLAETLKVLLELPNRVVEAISRGEVATLVRTYATELDSALYERFDEVAVARALPELEAAEAAGLASWLRERQAAEIERLSDLGLKRITTTIGSPFEPNRVVPDPTEDPRPTSRRELDQRVAGVRPGQGGYEFAGQLLCPTRAQPYVYRPEWQSDDQRR